MLICTVFNTKIEKIQKIDDLLLMFNTDDYYIVDEDAIGGTLNYALIQPGGEPSVNSVLWFLKMILPESKRTKAVLDKLNGYNDIKILMEEFVQS